METVLREKVQKEAGIDAIIMPVELELRLIPRIEVDLSQATPHGNKILAALGEWKKTPGYNGGLNAEWEARALLERGKEPLERFVLQLAQTLMPSGYTAGNNSDYPYVTEIVPVGSMSKSQDVVLMQYGQKGFDSLFRKVNHVWSLTPQMLEQMRRTGKQTSLYELVRTGMPYVVGDVYRARIVTKDLEALRRVQELIENKTQIVPGSIACYDEIPRKNGYRTRSFCITNPEDGRIVEIQLRTAEMHKAANSEAQRNYHLNLH